MLDKELVPSRHSTLEIEDNDGHGFSTAASSTAFGRSRATDMFESMVVFVSLAFHLKLEQRSGNQSIWCAYLSALFMFICLALASNHVFLLCRLYCVCYTCKARYHQA